MIIYETIRDVNKETVLRIANEVKRNFPDAWARAHRASNPAGSEFIRRVALALRAYGINAGVNGKRGNVNDLSQDPVTFPVASGGVRDGSGTYAQIAIIDLIGAAGSDNANITWIDVTQETIDKGDIGAFVLPEVSGTTPVPPPVTTPPPGGSTPPPAQPQPCQFKACACGVTSDDIDALFVAVGELSMLVRQMGEAVIGHVDDAKGRIERVSQELANKPTTPGCRLRF